MTIPFINTIAINLLKKFQIGINLEHNMSKIKLYNHHFLLKIIAKIANAITTLKREKMLSMITTNNREETQENHFKTKGPKINL